MAERCLLRLSFALMESFEVRVDGSPIRPMHPSRASCWVRAARSRRRGSGRRRSGTPASPSTDHRAQSTEHRATIREYTDAVEHARARPISAGSVPELRLRELADYLGLDWTWFVRRCAALGAYGTAGLVSPRSRLLSVAGLDRACRFVGDLSAAA